MAAISHSKGEASSPPDTSIFIEGFDLEWILGKYQRGERNSRRMSWENKLFSLRSHALLFIRAIQSPYHSIVLSIDWALLPK